jgi:putative transposase
VSWGFTGSSGFAGSSACVAGKNGSSRPRRTRGILCPWRRTCWIRNFEASAPNQIWLTDITYIPTGEGWLYLAGHKGLFTGEVVGYAMAGAHDEEPGRPVPLEGHSRQATRTGFDSPLGSGQPVLRPGIYLVAWPVRDEGSMSRKGNCYDNAPMESFWGMLKNEQIHQCRYSTRQEAIQDITGYIEIFYNRQRKQARLGFLSPVAYERWFYEKRLAA